MQTDFNLDIIQEILDKSIKDLAKSKRTKGYKSALARLYQNLGTIRTLAHEGRKEITTKRVSDRAPKQ